MGENANKTLQGIKTSIWPDFPPANSSGENANKTLQGIKTPGKVVFPNTELSENANKTLQGIKTLLSSGKILLLCMWKR